MRIAYLGFIELDVPGAGPVHVEEIAANLSRFGHSVEAFLPLPRNRYRWEKVKFHWVRSWGFDILRRLAFCLESACRIAAVHVRERFDLIYVREMALNPFLVPLSRMLNLPVFVEVNGWYLSDLARANPAYRRLCQFFQGITLRNARGVIASTEGFGGLVSSTFGIPESRILVADVGANVDLFQPGCRDEARRTLGLPIDSELITFLGGFHPDHDIVGLLRAFHQLGNSERVQLLLVGGGACESAVRREIAALGLHSKVIWPGIVPYDQVPLYLQSSDIAVLPLTGESLRRRKSCYTLKLWEYMACGLATIATDIRGSGSWEELTGKVCLVPPDAPGEVARVLHQLLEDPGYRERVGTDARQHVVENRSWRAVAGAIERFIEQELASQVRARH